ncbi:MAG: class I SAM-dependent methyltransferase [Lachnospiraceae bacterium]|nr:class I SAM-dependent methyltransferase [Lachnospiraceae bacterium]
MDEREFLDKMAETYRTFTSPISRWSIDSYMRVYKENLKLQPGNRALELGGGDGYSTECLSELVDWLDVVDGSRRMLEKMGVERFQKRNVTFIYSLFEELNYQEEYDNVFCSYVLEHVKEPMEILNVAYRALKPGGRLFITVPNATALSRQMALDMKLLNDLYELTKNDALHGHRRVFDLDRLLALLEQSPFIVCKSGGTFVKEFADFQLDQMIEQKIIGEEQLYGMQKLAKRYPNLSGSIYAVCEKTE